MVPDPGKYPFVPSNLAYTPSAYEFSTPVPTNLFPYRNRSQGVLSLFQTLSVVPFSTTSNFQGHDLKLLVSDSSQPYTAYTLNSTNPNLQSSTLHVTGRGELLQVEITSKLRNFKFVNFPSTVVGVEEFVLSISCKSALLKHRSTTFKSIDLQNRSLSVLEQYFPGTLSILSLSGNESSLLFTTKIQTSHIWVQEVLVAQTPALLTLGLVYDCPPEKCSDEEFQNLFPNSAFVTLSFQEKFRNDATLRSVRNLMSAIINSQWSVWPAHC
eukprot:TRINITY_DN7571_c0_g2_i3.p1 TRINITY_DN7571_c0_g2~~TRINITY_DN7571_c0_g2_i3.p1  ORF type:complete len:269 (-),score=51.14 TRINITY_DN7571_c0_g2_i3:111-917(-)